MKVQKSIAGVIALSGISATSLYAAQPPISTSVKSDVFYNTAAGLVALSNDVTPRQQCIPYAFNHSSYYMSGCANTASGVAALQYNLTGYANTATGAGTLRKNATGFNNTAMGALSMYDSTSGWGNSAFGTATLFSNSTGTHNAAAGSYALFSNTTGNANTTVGQVSMYLNTSGTGNAALGQKALYRNTTASYNTAAGLKSAYSNQVGAYNVALGSMALYANTSGFGNTAVGYYAGHVPVTGNYNTYVGYNVPGISTTDNYVTQIGVFSQPAGGPAYTPTTYIAGISTAVITGAQVVVNANGQLGVLASAERYKTDIAALGATSAKLAELRPVSFHLKSEPDGAIQYGLIAEEVNRVYPELVIHDKEGNIQGVRYDELAPMLLNEMQAETARIAALEQQNAAMKQQLAELSELKAELSAALLQLKASQSIIAKR